MFELFFIILNNDYLIFLWTNKNKLLLLLLLIYINNFIWYFRDFEFNILIKYLVII